MRLWFRLRNICMMGCRWCNWKRWGIFCQVARDYIWVNDPDFEERVIMVFLFLKGTLFWPVLLWYTVTWSNQEVCKRNLVLTLKLCSFKSRRRAADWEGSNQCTLHPKFVFKTMWSLFKRRTQSNSYIGIQTSFLLHAG